MPRLISRPQLVTTPPPSPQWVAESHGCKLDHCLIHLAYSQIRTRATKNCNNINITLWPADSLQITKYKHFFYFSIEPKKSTSDKDSKTVAQLIPTAQNKNGTDWGRSELEMAGSEVGRSGVGRGTSKSWVRKLIKIDFVILSLVDDVVSIFTNSEKRTRKRSERRIGAEGREGLGLLHPKWQQQHSCQRLF